MQAARARFGNTSGLGNPTQRAPPLAARQYLKALRSLADVRRLLIAPVQFNLAENQVNIAAAPGATVGSTAQRRRRPLPSVDPVPARSPASFICARIGPAFHSASSLIAMAYAIASSPRSAALSG